MPSLSSHTISSQSRNKLKAFQFVQHADADGNRATSDEQPNTDKENRVLEINADYSTVGPQVEQDSRHQKSVQSSFEQTKDIPQTPAKARIPLSDLIGNTEDAFNQEPNSKTPDDQVYWQHGPRSSDPTTSSHSSRRGKKRARSSSPPASSQNERGARFSAQKDAMDLHHLQHLLKTPQVDPAIDLWNRYADTTLDNSGDRNALPLVADLIGSSPQTPGAVGSKESTGLRRSISCGIEWPSSKAKRRKTDPAESLNHVRDIFAEHKNTILAADQQKVSKVSLLVEKIQDSMARRSRAETSGPSSSSPLPERSETLAGPPTPSRAERPSVTFANLPETRVYSVDQSEQPTKSNEARIDASSEFGGDELDLGLLESMELGAQPETRREKHCHRDAVNLQPQQVAVQSLAVGTVESAITQTTPGSQVTYGTHLSLGRHDDTAKRNNEPVAGDLDDEFDDDGIFLEADIELMMEYKETMSHDTGQDHRTEKAADISQELGANVDSAILDEFDDGFEDDHEIWTQLENSAGIEVSKEHMAPQPAPGPSKKRVRAIQRYLVVDVAESFYTNPSEKRRPEKVTLVRAEKTEEQKVILLRQSWYDTPVVKGCYVHLIGTFGRGGHFVVDDADNMVILHPDHLLSATVVADSFQCMRRAVLQDRVKATSEADKAQVYGSALHHILQAAMTNNRWDLEWLMATIEKILRTSFLESLHEIRVGVAEATDYLMSKMEDLRAWASIFIAATPSPRSVVQDRNGKQAKMSINKLLEVEEHVWSPMYGLKGNVDATIQVVMQDGAGAPSRTLTVPFEFKTGKRDTSDAHRAQTALYTLLMSDRYDVDVVYGILYYLETAKTFRIQGIRNEIRHMIIQRNFLASYVHNKLDLPPMIQRSHMCNKCYAQTSCFVYHKLVDGGSGQTSGLKDVFEDFVRHLKPLHADFFKKWDDLLTREERDAMKIRRELWTMLSTEREALGRCFSKVIIDPASVLEDSTSPKINRFQYSFVKQRPTAKFSFTESKLTTGEPIVISDEEGHFALANGYVTKVRPGKVTVAVDRRLHNVRTKGRKFDATSNQIFRGITDYAPNGTPLTPTCLDTEEPVLYRLDKDEFSNGMAGIRNNLIRMMEKDLFRARELRELIIEGQPPRFKPASSAYTLSGPSSQQNLNVDQKQAIEKAMSAQDYALVLGMPGTGKTTTIAHIIRALVSQGKSVLLTSYTHTAVDNILLKIKDDKIRILRLGAPAKVHPDVQTFADLAGLPKTSIEQLEDSYINSRVVATTCLGINHALFNSRIFDYCIVDEASQITLPVCLGPIRMARTFILVGDHYQLPPLVQNKEAQDGGLDISLFKTLSESRPEAVVSLSHQYRMAEDIMLLSNTLIYENRLKCGTPAVASRMLEIPNLPAGLTAAHRPRHACQPPSTCAPSTAPHPRCISSLSSCFLHRALSPSSRVVFLNTDPLGSPAREHLTGSRITNPLEATITSQLVHTLLSAGLPASSIGVIAVYRSQLALLRQHLSSAVAAGLEMHTADKFQGRDKEVVVLSCVRSNAAGQVGELLRDWRRVNVAMTRARSKLIVVGSQGTMEGSGVETLRGLVRICGERGWVLDLPEGAVESHGRFDGAMMGSSMALTSSSSPVKTRVAATTTTTDSRHREDGITRGARQPLRELQPRVSLVKSWSQPPVKRSPTKSPVRKKMRKLPPFKQPKKIMQGAKFQVEKATEVGTVVGDILNEIGYDGL